MPTGTIVVVVEPFFVDSSQHWRASLSWCLGHDLARWKLMGVDWGCDRQSDKSFSDKET